MSPLDILVVLFVGAVLVGRLRSPLVRGASLPAARLAALRPAAAARTPRRRVCGSAGQSAPRAA
jgi:hypothetical protein